MKGYPRTPVIGNISLLLQKKNNSLQKKVKAQMRMRKRLKKKGFIVSKEEDDSVLRSKRADIGRWWCGRGPRRAPVVFC